MVQPEILRLDPLRSVAPLDQPAALQQASTALGCIETATVDGRANTETVIMGLPWSEFVARRDAFDRYGIMARAMGGISFTAVDNPGIGPRASGLDRENILRIRAGNFSSIAKAQWKAIGDTDTTVALLGNSQGASTVAALAANAPKTTAIEKLFLWEPITKKQSTSRLVTRFGFEAIKWGKYLGENPEWMAQPGNGPLIPKAILPHIAAYYSYPVGLSKAKIFDDIKTARERGIIAADTEIAVVSGEQSRVCPPNESGLFAERLERELGLSSVRLVLLEGESHGLIDSSMRVSKLLEYFYPVHNRS